MIIKMRYFLLFSLIIAVSGVVSGEDSGTNLKLDIPTTTENAMSTTPIVYSEPVVASQTPFKLPEIPKTSTIYGPPIEYPLTDGETYHSILPIGEQTSEPYHIAVIGDSIAWGNGLYQKDKYYNQVAEHLRITLGRPIEITVYAHSGAVISGTTDKLKDPNLNSGYPTLKDQAEYISDDADLILVSGGINDVGLGNIADANTPADIVRDRSLDIKEKMKELLTRLMEKTAKTDAKKTEAKIIVTGYYPLITDKSDLEWYDKVAMAALATESEKTKSQTSNVLNAAFDNPTGSSAQIAAARYLAEGALNNAVNSYQGDSKQRKNSDTFYVTSKESLETAVKDVNNAYKGENRVVFIDPSFEGKNSYGASESLLWKLNSLTKSNDDQSNERYKLTNPIDIENQVNAIGHPNVAGASKYADLIVKNLDGSDWLSSTNPTDTSKSNTQGTTQTTGQSTTTTEETKTAAVDGQEISPTNTLKSNTQGTTQTTSQSTNAKFSLGDRVEVTTSLGLHVRSVPGDLKNDPTIPLEPMGSLGTIQEGSRVYKNGFYWVEIMYADGKTGWSAENWLKLAPTNTVEVKPPVTQPENLLPATPAIDATLYPITSLPPDESNTKKSSTVLANDLSSSNVQETAKSTQKSNTKENSANPTLYPITSPPPDESNIEESSDIPTLYPTTSPPPNELAEIQETSFGAVDTSFGPPSSSSDVQSQPFGSSPESDLGGVNFTSIKLNYVSVSTDNLGGIYFDFGLKAQKAEGASPGINPINSTLIGATAFMTGLAVPDNKFWVNLNPWEQDRIIDEQLSQSEVGRIMLESDLQMKRDFCNYGNPCANETGKALWDLLEKKHDALTKQCMDKFPGEIKDINNVQFKPVTRHWIVPDKVYAYTNGTQIYIINASLSVNSEPVANHSSFLVNNQENRALSKGCLEELDKSAKEYGEYNKELEDRMIKPYVVWDVNHGEKYEDLREVYVALALAQWYKSKITSQMDIFRESLSSSNSTVLKSIKPWNPNNIWDKYVYSFKNGEYKCWENETTKTATGNHTTSSFSSAGGVDFGNIRANLVEIEGLPPAVQDQVKRTVMDGIISEGKNVFFGSRLHVDLIQDNTVSSSGSQADPNLALTWYNKGIVFQDQGKLDEAIEAYDEATRRDSNLAEAWNNKGSALNNLGKYEEALKAFDEAIRLTSEANAAKT